MRDFILGTDSRRTGCEDAMAVRMNRWTSPGDIPKEYVLCWRSPLGAMILTSDGEFLTGLRFCEAGECVSAPPPCGRSLPQVFEETLRWLDIYFSGRVPSFVPNLTVRASDFRKTVWDIVRTIPYGRTASYGEIAAETARRTGRARVSAQAVGGAVGRNPFLLMIPCHRVIGADGSLTGYAGGLDRKKRLLALEGVVLR